MKSSTTYISSEDESSMVINSSEGEVGIVRKGNPFHQRKGPVTYKINGEICNSYITGMRDGEGCMGFIASKHEGAKWPEG